MPRRISTRFKDVEADTNIEIGKRLRRCRRTRCMTLTDVGALLDLDYRNLQKLESGYGAITAARLIRLAAAYGVPAAYFMENHKCLTPPNQSNP